MKPLHVPGLSASVDSFLLCCHALQLLNAARRGATSPDELHTCVLNFLHAHQLAYGNKYWVYKHHMAAHIAEMWRRSGVLCNCLVHERKHKLVKRFVQNRTNSAGYENGLMMQMIAQTAHDLQLYFRTKSGLINPRSAGKKLVSAIQSMRPGSQVIDCSSQARLIGGALISRGDIVLLGRAYNFKVAQVWFHLRIDESELSLVVLHEVHRIDPDKHWCQCIPRETPAAVLIPTAHIQCAAIARITDSIITVLWPLEFARLT